MTKTWFHGTPHKLAIGDVLRPGVVEVNFKESDKNTVSVTTEESYAMHWARESGKKLGSEQVYVYVVEPIDEPEVWRQGMKNYGKDVAVFEARTASARITEIVFGEGVDSFNDKNYSPTGVVVNVAA